MIYGVSDCFLKVLISDSSEDITFGRMFLSRRLEVTAVMPAVCAEACVHWTLLLELASHASVTDGFSLTASCEKSIIVLAGERANAQRGLSNSPELCSNTQV